MVAASYRSVGTPFRAARNSTMAEPNCHTRSRQMTNSAQVLSASQSGPAMPKKPRMVLTTPVSLNRARHRTAMATEPPRMDGM